MRRPTSRSARRRRGAAAAYVRHNVAAQDCPADARQHLCVGLRVGAALALRETDRCLNVAAAVSWAWSQCHVLASLAAGASVVCTPGCDVSSFFAWLTAFQPTWYSAVPTMHQAILAQARHNRERVADCRLRFVRSASAPLPPRIFAELEQTFETSVIECYGMTETASSPIACNPLPPRQRKAGSVGIPVALDVAIMDEEGACCPAVRPDRSSSVARASCRVTTATEMATRAAFAGDWFKTGDLGFFDDDGYLFLVGRMREIINRGGEKIAPREVDEVLLRTSGGGRGRNLCRPPRHAG